MIMILFRDSCNQKEKKTAEGRLQLFHDSDCDGGGLHHVPHGQGPDQHLRGLHHKADDSVWGERAWLLSHLVSLCSVSGSDTSGEDFPV